MQDRDGGSSNLTPHTSAINMVTNASLRERLSHAPEHYLSAISHGDATRHQFLTYWKELTSGVASDVRGGLAENELLQLVSNSTHLIETMEESFTILEKLADSVVVETKDALARLTLEDDGQTSTANSRNLDPNVPSPTYIHAAYEWLMENIHNPYPSSRIKRDLARRAGLPTSHIHAWFKEVRRRIGWIHFCRRHFRGSRTLAVEAACRVLLPHERASSVPLEVEVDVLSLLGVAECLYPDRVALRSSRRDGSSVLLPSRPEFLHSDHFKLCDTPPSPLSSTSAAPSPVTIISRCSTAEPKYVLHQQLPTPSH